MDPQQGWLRIRFSPHSSLGYKFLSLCLCTYLTLLLGLLFLLGSSTILNFGVNKTLNNSVSLLDKVQKVRFSKPINTTNVTRPEDLDEPAATSRYTTFGPDDVCADKSPLCYELNYKCITKEDDSCWLQKKEIYSDDSVKYSYVRL